MQRPGDIITPASFTVAPELLGRPLASPSRRAGAMMIDLILVAILGSAGAVFFGVAAAFALWRASARADFASRRPFLRKTLRIAAAFVLFLVVVTNWGSWTRPLLRLASTGSSQSAQDDEDRDSAFVDPGQRNVKMSFGNLAAAGTDFIALRQAKDEKAARRAADKLVSRMQKQGMRAEDMRDAARGFAQDSNDGTLPPIGAAALQKAVDAAFPRDTSQVQRDRLRDSLAVAYTAALAKPDSSAAGDLRPKVVEAFSANTIAEVSRKLAQAEAQNRSLRKRLDAARAEAKKGAGFVDTMAGAGGELVKLARKAGLGFGWLGLYFTGFVAMMRGQTPGKWLMRIRIVRLDGRPMGWWAALERFGGYAASVVTALSGFFQILWDKNRQAMHDKIAETVVVKA